jgi:hypothetical protein
MWLGSEGKGSEREGREEKVGEHALDYASLHPGYFTISLDNWVARAKSGTERFITN